MRDEVLLELHANLQSQYKLLPKMEVLINTNLSGKYMEALTFLLHKASKVTRTFNINKHERRAEGSGRLPICQCYVSLHWLG